MDIESLVDNLIDATEDVAMKDPGMIGMANCETAMVDARRKLIEYVDGLEAEVKRLTILDQLSGRLVAKYKAQADEIDRRYLELEAENARLREERRWIPVKERLPQVGEWVMIFEKSGGVSNVFVDFENYETRTDIEWFGADDVTHWMPLPEPPDVE